MSFRIILLTLRAIVLIVAATFLAYFARGYFQSQWNLSVSPRIFGIALCALLPIVVWASTRGLFRELAINSERRQQTRSRIRPAGEQLRYVAKYKFPLWLAWSVLALGLGSLFLPFSDSVPGKPIALVNYILGFGLAGIMLSMAIYLFVYSAVIKDGKVLVGAFVKREYLLSDITSVDILKGGRGPEAAVYLRGGRILRFDGLLTDFPSLVAALGSHTDSMRGSNTDRSQ